MVTYDSEFIQSFRNGSLCMVYMTSSNAYGGPIDLGSVVLMHITPDLWTPPAPSASVSPTQVLLADTKYGLTLSPSGEVANVVSEKYYA